MWREKKTTHLKNISQIGSFPQVVRGENKNNWNHYLEKFYIQ